MKVADEIREFAYKEYIKPAREHSQTQITISAGDVHDKMGLKNRMPAVTGALGKKIFERQYEVELTDRKGVTNGPNVFFTFLLTKKQEDLS